MRRPAPSRRTVGLVFALLTVTFGSALAAPLITVDDPSWRLESSYDSIALYRGSVRGSGVVPVKLVMTIPGTIEEVSLVLEDIPRRPDWIGNRTESVLLERASDYDQLEYLHVDMPWPACDRSAVIRAQVEVSDDRRRATISAESVESHAADRFPKFVRARVYASTFQMSQAPGRVEVVALVFIDPCGIIPKWIVNYFARRVARGTLSGLRRQVAKKLYSKAQVEAMHRRMWAYPSLGEKKAATP